MREWKGTESRRDLGSSSSRRGLGNKDSGAAVCHNSADEISPFGVTITNSPLKSLPYLVISSVFTPRLSYIVHSLPINTSLTAIFPASLPASAPGTCGQVSQSASAGKGKSLLESR